MNRRTLLGLSALGFAASVSTACSSMGGSRRAGRDSGTEAAPGSRPPKRIRYGSGPEQFGELHLPADGRAPKGVVVVIHGGFWLAEYDYTLGSPLAASLADHGWAAWNIEYRRIGDGGGSPATMDDVAAAVDKVADLGLDVATRRTVVGLGHSAGGQLAAFAGSRGRFGAWSPTGVELTHVIAQAGVMDLRAADEQGLGDGAVKTFLGHAPGSDDDPIDPIRQVPLTQPVWCVHGDADTNVPFAQSKSYVEAATAAGAEARLIQVAGDHFALISPTSPAWKRTLAILDSIA